MSARPAVQTPRGELHVLADAEVLFRAVADRFAEHAEDAVRERGRFAVALTGGGTPEPAYRLLASPPWRERVPWRQVHLFWGDERSVPPDHPRSNYRMARRVLLDHVPVPAAQVHRMRGELPAARAAAEYELVLHDVLGPEPRLDLVHLGVGADAHVASLFPFSPLLLERERLAAPALLRSLGEPRVTLTPPALTAARRVELILSGQRKAAVARRLIRGPLDPLRLPAQTVRPSSGERSWLLDAAAAERAMEERG